MKLVRLFFIGLLASSAVFGAGRQLTGVYAPASTPPLSPDEAAKKFTLPEGFEMRIFASEPQVVNPVAMSWDERGRLWVLELYEYPLGAAPGTKGRDQVKILEDTDNDGKADKVTIFKDGLNLATGLLLGYGGVFVGQAPHLYFFQDTDGDDRADKETIVKTGFGLEDRHELLNGFTWGPDGYLYMTQGVFTRSKVRNPDDPNDSGVLMTAAVARLHPRTRKFEIFGEGTSNPWGVDFDGAGNAFVSACVIEHLFHIAPGGLYQRQAGNPPFQYAYQLLPSINDHKHFRAAYAGVQIYQGDQYPDEYKGTIFMGNIHDSAVHQDKLTPNGSSFKASFVRDLIRANDGWFRPVSSQVGPDGNLWVMDWYDKYPCYQNANADPEGVDRERGRIWRLVYTGKDKGKALPSHPEKMNLGKASTEELVKTLSHPNIWQRRMAQRVLSERQDSAAKAPLVALFQEGSTAQARLAALWTLHTTALLDDQTLNAASKDKEPAIRAWSARLTGERAQASEEITERLETLASDDDPSVRLAVATALRQFSSGSLTIDTPPAAPQLPRFGTILGKVILHPQSADDPLIPFMAWMAAEPFLGDRPQTALRWLARNGMSSPKICAELTRKTMRRISDSNDPALLRGATAFLDQLPEDSTPLIVAGLDGLIEGQKGRAMAPDSSATPVLAKLSRSGNKEVASRAGQLGSIWGDASAVQATLEVARNEQKSPEERIAAIQSVRQQKIPAVRDVLLALLEKKTPEKVQQSAIGALSEVGGDETGEQILKHWKSYPPATRRIAAEVLTSRNRWAQSLISAVERKEIQVAEIPPTVVRSLTSSKDDYVRNRAVAVIGRYRESSPDKLKLLSEKKKIVLNGPIDLQKGHELAQRTCLTCHKLHGEGADVGPDLTGVGRSTLEALLANVIDPNQIIGKGYENVEVETKDGRSVSGRLVEDTDNRVRLLSAGPKEEIIGKREIASMRVSEMSVMPEGLEQMPDDDFRNLIWFMFSPPQDKKPVTPQEEQKALRESQASVRSREQSPFDGESVALWNPEWKLNVPQFEHSPRKLPEYAGRHNVLLTHPFDQEKPAALERIIDLPPGKRISLSVDVASHEQGDWELRILANNQLLKKELVDGHGKSWKTVTIDLSAYAGKKVALRLENAANNWEWEFGYWSNLRIKVEDLKQASR
jgi:putative membrane-bound dehydrogenase-like protein